MNLKKSRFCLCLSLALTLLFALQALADEDPSSRVARMNYSQGSVSFQPAGEVDWVTAVPNRPLFTGDNLWADDGSLAEVHVGSTVLRLSHDTGVTLLELSDNVLQLRLAQGSLIVRIRRLDSQETVEIDTPNVAITPLREGEYRIDVNSDGDRTITTVLRGQAEVTGGGRDFQVLAGQEVRLKGIDSLSYDLDSPRPPDNFQNWATRRDLHEDRAETANYVSREMTGYEDLDDYGQWHYVANYGPMWVPTAVPAGWAPYRYGHWAWIQPFGWTWVEDEPWGFAPFHYGRWVNSGGQWGWVPGPAVARPVYAPALVAFVGGGGGIHLSVSLGGGAGVAWFPLAPGEVYVPTYHASRAYVNNVNVANTNVDVTRVTNVYNNYTINNNVTRITYANQHVDNAVTVVNRDTFTNARPVARNTVQVSRSEIEAAPVSHNSQVAPIRASVIGSGAPTRSVPPPAIAARPVVARRTSPPPPPAPFQQRQAADVSRPPQPQPVTRPPQPPEPVRPGQSGTGVPPQPTVTGLPDPRRPNDAARPPRETAPPAPAAAPQRPAPPPVPQRPEPAAGPQRPPAAEPPRPQPASHPLVKPVPPVQPNPNHAEEVQTKNRQWQQQRQQTAPPKNEKTEPPMQR